MSSMHLLSESSISLVLVGLTVHHFGTGKDTVEVWASDHIRSGLNTHGPQKMILFLTILVTV